MVSISLDLHMHESSGMTDKVAPIPAFRKSCCISAREVPRGKVDLETAMASVFAAR